MAAAPLPGSSPKNLDIHYDCLDMFPIRWSEDNQSSARAILLEIYRTGCLVQIDVPVAEGSQVELVLPGRNIEAQVASCEEDSYGFLLRLSVTSQHDDWFPDLYCPAYLRCDDSEK
jgi:hypothetical protein